jgi:DNA-binding NarL/FixJ family response regulator
LNQELAMQLISRFSRRAHGLREPAASPAASQPRGADESPPEALTPRELEVLGLLARGKSNPQIAQELTISRATAKTHVERIIGKLGVSDRTQAALRAIELGLVTLEARE